MVLTFISLIYSAFSLSCLDSSGNPTDYWTILKSPAGVGQFGDLSFIYATSQQPSFILSTSSLNTTSPMTATLSQLNKNTSISFLSINDCTPPECSSNYNYTEGQTKAIFGWTQTEAFALFHSIPAFPVIVGGGKISFDFVNGDAQFAQHLFCVSLTPQTLFNLAGVMSIELPRVYYTSIKYPNANISMLTTNQVLTNDKNLTYSFNTAAGAGMTFFAKTGNLNVDFYESIVSSAYGDGLLVESWGRPYEKDFCPPSYPYKNVNVKSISFGSLYWPSFNDNSKWAVGMNSGLVCYGDFNRMYSQWSRSGGGVCMINQALRTAHFQIIETNGVC